MSEWRAACMDDDEWRLWNQANRSISAGSHRVDRPCRECPLGFALEMRAINRCNGEPSGAPEPDEEEEPMEVARISSQRVSVNVAAPCATCLHRDVCAIKEDVDRAGSAEVGLPQLSPALKPVLSLVLDCAFYLRDKAAGKTVSDEPKKRNWSPEQRQAAADRLAAMRAAKAAKAAEREAAA